VRSFTGRPERMQTIGGETADILAAARRDAYRVFFDSEFSPGELCDGDFEVEKILWELPFDVVFRGVTAPPDWFAETVRRQPVALERSRKTLELVLALERARTEDFGEWATEEAPRILFNGLMDMLARDYALSRVGLSTRWNLSAGLAVADWFRDVGQAMQEGDFERVCRARRTCERMFDVPFYESRDARVKSVSMILHFDHHEGYGEFSVPAALIVMPDIPSSLTREKKRLDDLRRYFLSRGGDVRKSVLAFLAGELEWSGCSRECVERQRAFLEEVVLPNRSKGDSDPLLEEYVRRIGEA